MIEKEELNYEPAAIPNPGAICAGGLPNPVNAGAVVVFGAPKASVGAAVLAAIPKPEKTGFAAVAPPASAVEGAPNANADVVDVAGVEKLKGDAETVVVAPNRGAAVAVLAGVPNAKEVATGAAAVLAGVPKKFGFVVEGAVKENAI